MSKNLFLPSSIRNRGGVSRRASQPGRQGARFRPRPELLERRELLAAAIFEVTNTNDSGDGSLRSAVLAANENPGADVIKFARGVHGEIELDAANGELAITDDLTIRGPGADKLAVSGEDATRVFSVLPAGLVDDPLTLPTLDQLATSPKVSIERLTIQQGLATNALGFDPSDPTNSGFAFGGGIYNLGGTLHLERVHMSGNVAANVVTAGGAVANEFGGTLTVERSRFTGNASNGFLIAVGGAITSDLGPALDPSSPTDVTTEQPEVHVSRSTFEDNVAAAAAGYIDGVAFSGLGGGGAILNVTGTMSISRSHFANNLAQGGAGNADSTSGGPAFGGAILTGDASPFGIADSSLVVSRSTFAGNQAQAGAGVAEGIPGGQAGGGAVSVGNLSNAELARNEFVDNSATGGDGGQNADGGIGNGGGVSGSGGAELTLQRNEFLSNLAAGGAGLGSGSSAAGRGGGLGLDSVQLAGFVPGPAVATVNRDVYHGNLAEGAGGAVYNEGDLQIDRAKISANRAVASADVMIAFYPGYVFQGAALGGGITNLGTLQLSGSSLHDNRAVGADGATGPNVIMLPPGTALPTYPGIAVGGGLHTIGSATIRGSRIVGNEAVAGDNNSGSFAGVANGGGIYNDGAVIVSHSSLLDNLAQGGDANLGDINAGGGYGGGITSGTVTALIGVRSASADISHSVVSGNQAVGGSGNANLFPVPVAHAPNGATGGGIVVYQGTASIDSSIVSHNEAVAGDDGFGSGGGVFAFGFVGPVSVEISHSLISHNRAIGSDALGGGIGAGSLGSFFGNPVNLSVAHSLIFKNLAQGSDGGDGLGGGIYNAADSTLELARSLVFGNRASAQSGGEGVGGGLYNLGTAELVRSRIFANLASTSDDDCFGC